MRLRWGILGTGKISWDFSTALLTLPQREHSLIAVAARRLDDARNLAVQQEAVRHYQGYESLARDPEVGMFFFIFLHFLNFEKNKR